MTATDNDKTRAEDMAKAEPWPGMSMAEFRYVEKFIEHGKAKLGIIDQTVLLSTTPAIDDKNYAQVLQRSDREEWIIELNSRWPTFTVAQKRSTLTHELFHVVVGPYTQFVDDIANHYVANATAGLVKNRLVSNEELLVNRLAKAMLPLMPAYPVQFGGKPVESKVPQKKSPQAKKSS